MNLECCSHNPRSPRVNKRGLLSSAYHERRERVETGPEGLGDRRGPVHSPRFLIALVLVPELPKIKGQGINDYP